MDAMNIDFFDETCADRIDTEWFAVLGYVAFDRRLQAENAFERYTRWAEMKIQKNSKTTTIKRKTSKT